MTKTVKESYQELIALTQSYLLEEFERKAWVTTDDDTLEFFRKASVEMRQKQQMTPQQVRAPIPPTPLPKPMPAPLAPTPAPVHQKPAPIEPPAPKPLPEAIKAPIAPTPTPAPVPVVAEEPARRGNSRFAFVLEAPTPSTHSVDYIQKIIEEKAPEVVLLNMVPDDAKAKLAAEKWKLGPVLPEVVILSFQEIPEQKVFLRNLADAIKKQIAPTVIYSAIKIEEKDAWEKLFESKSLKLMITTDYGMYTLPKLMKHYREPQEGSAHLLGGVPLLLLSDLALYIKEPSLKVALWRAIKKMMAVE